MGSNFTNRSTLIRMIRLRGLQNHHFGCSKNSVAMEERRVQRLPLLVHREKHIPQRNLPATSSFHERLNLSAGTGHTLHDEIRRSQKYWDHNNRCMDRRCSSHRAHTAALCGAARKKDWQLPKGAALRTAVNSLPKAGYCEFENHQTDHVPAS